MSFPSQKSCRVSFFQRLAIVVIGLTTIASATNSVPWIRMPMSQTSVAAGSPAFTLNIFGTGFSANAKIFWNGVKRNTIYYSSTEVGIALSSSDIAVPGTATVQVENGTPGGGYSNIVYFPIGISKTALTGVLVTAPAASGAGWPAAGDFNGDGKLDVAAVNVSANSVSVFLGYGDGTFQPHVDYAVGVLPGYVVTGDFNGDGKLDLAVANRSSNNVSILLGNGDGTFQAAINSNAGNWPAAVAAADFNHDGKLDLVVPNQFDNSVSVLLGNGDGTFQSPLAAATGTAPVHVAVADFDFDGKLDVVVANSNCVASVCGIGSISVLRGKGDGTFKAKHDFQSDYGTNFVAAATFFAGPNAAPDVIAVNASVSGGNGTVGYFQNSGAGTFKTAVEYPTGANSTAVVIGDFNDDNKLDLAVLNSGGASLTLEFGNGQGTFGGNGITATNFNLNGAPTGLAVGDFNNDGQLDFVSSDNIANELDILTQQQAPAGVTLSATSLNFGVQPVEKVSPTKKVTLTNSGGAALAISSITASATQFLESNNCPASLAGGLTCTISVAFDPTADNNFSGTVTINDNAANSPQTITVSGNGTFTEYSTTSLNFGNVPVGGTSSLPVTLTNLSINSVNIISVNIHGTGRNQFSETNNCGSTLAGKASCTFTVTFGPSFTGTRDATMNVSTSGGPEGMISLTGTGQ